MPISSKTKKELKQIIKDKIIYLKNHADKISSEEIELIKNEVYTWCAAIGDGYGYNAMSFVDKIYIKACNKEIEKKRCTTVGQLIEELSKYDKNMPIYIEHYVEYDDPFKCGLEERCIDEIYDLKSRIILKAGESPNK